jgi:CRP-like cAMP-binding protein
MPNDPDSKGLTGNLVLDSLPPQDIAKLSLKTVTVSPGQVLYECDERMAYAYFPTTSVISCLHTTRTGATTETAVVGNDGVIGTALFLADGASPHQAVAQIGGNALRMPATLLQSEFARGGAFQTALLRYTHSLIIQISQTAVCNRLHPLEQRLCRWLLLCHDRVGGSELFMTQELIASMIGGRRESVTVAAGHLQDLGLLRYSRGHIAILSREGLERLTCECYELLSEALCGTKVVRAIRPLSPGGVGRGDGATLSAD